MTNEFREVVQDSRFIDMGFSRRLFTWSNKRYRQYMWKNAWKDVFTVQFGKIIFMIRWLLTWGRGFQTTVQ